MACLPAEWDACTSTVPQPRQRCRPLDLLRIFLHMQSTLLLTDGAIALAGSFSAACTNSRKKNFRAVKPKKIIDRMLISERIWDSNKKVIFSSGKITDGGKPGRILCIIWPEESLVALDSRLIESHRRENRTWCAGDKIAQRKQLLHDTPTARLTVVLDRKHHRIHVRDDIVAAVVDGKAVSILFVQNCFVWFKGTDDGMQI